MEAEKYAAGFGITLEGDVVVKGKKEYLVPAAVRSLAQSIPLEPFSIGLPLGEVSAKGFKPSFALLDLLKGSRNRIVVNDEAEWLFTCGRDVFMDKVVHEGDLQREFLVTNKRGEVLGLGRKEMDRKHVIIKNVYDRGDFLHREERRKRR